MHSLFHAFLHQLQRIPGCIPAVDHKRHFFLSGNLHLCAKHLLLNLMFPFFFMPVIIQSNLSDRNCLWQMAQTTDLIQCILCHLFRIIRVNSKGAIDKGIFFHQFFCRFQTLDRCTCIYNMSNSMCFHRIQ